ncbi:hypothetical protein V492_03487 [Pseudogymnoascus sp. VKM F-4246]|nr:hypothetical protein V492_03487 [Pseudogymnoascus sp. VKM F-4246]
MSTTAPQGRKPAFVLSHPRTASNLFMKIFKSHPDVVPAEYPFLDVFFHGNEPQSSYKGPKVEEARTEFLKKTGVPKSYQEAFEKLEEDIRKAGEQNKVAFVKEHVLILLKPSVIDNNLETPRPPHVAPHLQPKDAVVRVSTNPTLLPDDLMLSVSPIFLIRHPALAFSSWYKTVRSVYDAGVDNPDFPVGATFQWTRILYDWYLNSSSEPSSGSPETQCRKPTVIDADDTMSDRAVLERLCHQLQLDPEKLSFEWQPMTTGLHPFLSSIQQSTGVDMSKLSKGVDIKQEFVKWEQEFGSHVAQRLLHFVELAMPDYEYLLAQRE